jgi:IclR family KDG regulon transcriptional repressor
MVVLDHGTVRLGVRLLHLAAAVLASLDLRRIARPVMQELVARTEETVNVGVLSGSEVVYIDIVPTPLPIKLSSEVGRTCPAYCTALGKALLAWAPSEEFDRLVQRMHWTRYTPRTAVGREALVRACAQVRERGWAVDDEEFEEGVRCLAVPLRDHTGAVRAALSLSGPEFRMPERRWPALLAALRDAQATIEAALGWSGAASQAVGAAASQVVGAAVSASDAAPSGASPAAPTASPAAAGRPGPAPGRRGSRAARR